MRRILIVGAILLCMSLSSCQCSYPPSVGPVEEDEQAYVAPTIETPVAVSRAA